MSSTTNKIIIGAIIIVAIGGYIFWSSSDKDGDEMAVGTTSASSETINPGSTGTTSTPGNATSNGAYKDGTYTGTTANSVYGDVQVSATISGGKITDVTFIKMPSEQGHTDEVTAMSKPILKSEAIASQSASVNIISGATQTVEAFQQSLQSALTQAQA